MFNNVKREFAEELLGRPEFEESRRCYTPLEEIEIINQIDYFVNKGLIGVYFLGIGLDCLTSKPEIFTALIIERELIDILKWSEFVDSFEGRRFEVEFSPQQLLKNIRGEKIMPAAAACMHLAKKHFEILSTSSSPVS